MSEPSQYMIAEAEAVGRVLRLLTERLGVSGCDPALALEILQTFQGFNGDTCPCCGTCLDPDGFPMRD